MEKTNYKLNDISDIKQISFVDKVICVLLAMSPILQHYKGIFGNAGVTVLIICFPFLVVKILMSARTTYMDSICFVLPLILFDIYKAMDHTFSVSSIARSGLTMIVYIAVSNNYVNRKYFLNVCMFISELASVLIICQYVCYYILGFHLKLAPVNLLLPESSQWIGCVTTGLVSITGSSNGYYRPSAFFLEPSHFFLFVFPILLLILLSEGYSKKKMHKSILLTVGLLLSTSGMAITVVVAAWTFYLLFYSKYSDKFVIQKLLSFKSIMLLIVGVFVLVVLYIKVPFVQSTVNRIVIGDQYGNTAISGRTLQANELLEQMHGGKQLLFGVTKDISDIEFNLSGYAATMYRYGLIGVVLSYIIYVRGVIQLKRHFKVVSMVIFVISFFTAHTHGTYHLIYYVLIIIEGFNVQKKQVSTESQSIPLPLKMADSNCV